MQTATAPSKGNKRIILLVVLAGAVAIFVTSFYYRLEHPSTVMEVKQSQPTQADQSMDRVRSLMQALSENPDDPAVLLSLGRAFMSMHAPDRALGFLSKARELDPENPAVPQAIGMAYFQAGNYDESLAAFEEAAKLDPDDPGSQFNLGMLKKHYLNATDQAEVHFRMVLVIEHEDADLKNRARAELGEEPEKKSGPEK